VLVVVLPWLPAMAIEGWPLIRAARGSDFQAGGAGRGQFGVRRRDRCADHHQWRPGGATADGIDGCRVLLTEHPHPAAAQILQHLAVLGVRAADVEAPIGQDPCQGRHADPANPDEVERLLTIELKSQGLFQT